MTDIVKIVFFCQEQDIATWQKISELLSQGKSGMMLQDFLDKLAPDAGDLLDDLFEEVDPSELYAEYTEQNENQFMFVLMAGSDGDFVASEFRKLFKALPVTNTRVAVGCDDAM
ncbi:hypothetical protein ACFSJ3_16915 [Corallincola platygyrae]|uniref:Uncharacterized protein n=1 Tax=Corallincola platygyrae TaxID=1193278 RepID=A0ABW4XT72_9GAMM